MRLAGFVLAVLGLGILAVVLAMFVVLMGVSALGWMVRSLLAMERLGSALASRLANRSQISRRLGSGLQTGRSGRMASA